MSIVQIGAFDVHVDQTVGDKDGGDEIGGDHACVGLFSQVGDSLVCAFLEDVGEGFLDEGCLI